GLRQGEGGEQGIFHDHGRIRFPHHLAPRGHEVEQIVRYQAYLRIGVGGVDTVVPVVENIVGDGEILVTGAVGHVYAFGRSSGPDENVVDDIGAIVGAEKDAEDLRLVDDIVQDIQSVDTASHGCDAGIVPGGAVIVDAVAFDDDAVGVMADVNADTSVHGVHHVHVPQGHAGIDRDRIVPGPRILGDVTAPFQDRAGIGVEGNHLGRFGGDGKGVVVGIGPPHDPNHQGIDSLGPAGKRAGDGEFGGGRNAGGGATMAVVAYGRIHGK